MNTYALVDCNNFYVSCERLFRPDLKNRPVLVLSNNDGCVISRSAEVKALGIRMGVPYYQLKDLIQAHHLAVFSSNYALYADLSNRVQTVLESMVPRTENYSIDESFLDLSDMTRMVALESYGREIKHKVEQWTGIPVCVGIAPTKTLAKHGEPCGQNLQGNGRCRGSDQPGTAAASAGPDAGGGDLGCGA